MVLACVQHTDGLTGAGADHGYKLLLALLLGVSEEVSWREAFLEDTSNFSQAFVWGVNHLVVGEGMSNPWLYGFVAFIYAYLLGVSRLRAVRYANHSAIEYLIMDNLVKPN